MKAKAKAENEVKGCLQCHGPIFPTRQEPGVQEWTPRKEADGNIWFCSFQCNWEATRCEPLNI